MSQTHEFCITYGKLVEGETVEVYHHHAEATTDEQAAVVVAIQAANEGVDVTDCDVRIKVIKVMPPGLKNAIKAMLAVNDFTKVEERASQFLVRESIEKGVGDSVGAEKINGVWVFPSVQAETEYYRRLATVLDTATPANPFGGSNLH